MWYELDQKIPSSAHKHPQDHYRNTGRPIQFPTIFCVQFGKNKFKFPMEFCTLLPGQQFKRPTSDGDLTAAILKFTPKDPRTRLDFIIEALKPTGVLNYHNGNSYLSQAGISIDSSPLKVPGTILPCLDMAFKGKTAVVGMFQLHKQKGILRS